MSKSKFTQGPWEVNTTEDELWGDDVWYRVEYHSVIANDETIASDISSKANAALIAAAPEMYAMLEDLLDKFRNDEFAPEIEKLLKKARGEA